MINGPNGRFLAEDGDGDYIVYNALNPGIELFGSVDGAVIDNGIGNYISHVGDSYIRVYSNYLRSKTRFAPFTRLKPFYGDGGRESFVFPVWISWLFKDVVAKVCHSTRRCLPFLSTQLCTGDFDTGESHETIGEHYHDNAEYLSSVVNKSVVSTSFGEPVERATYVSLGVKELLSTHRLW